MQTYLMLKRILKKKGIRIGTRTISALYLTNSDTRWLLLLQVNPKTFYHARKQPKTPHCDKNRNRKCWPKSDTS